MRVSVSSALKRQVAIRSKGRCEYCLLPEIVSFYSFHVDHIISIKHGGKSILQNLAYCCPDCNNYKGSDIGTFLIDDESIVRFFNPRKELWQNHFELSEGEIIGKTNVGKSTVKLFRFNDADRLIFRKQLISLGLYKAI